MPEIDALPTPPSRGDPTNFAARGDAFMAAFPHFVDQANALASNIQLRNYLAQLEVASVKHSDYGAIGDGAAVDTTAINAACAANGAVYVPPGTYLAPGIDTATCAWLFGGGPASIIKSTSNSNILSVGADGAAVSNLSCLGDGKGATLDAGKSGQNGISLAGRHRCQISNIHGKNLGGALVYADNTNGLPRDGNVITNVFSDSCNIGIDCGNGGEYISVAGGSLSGGNVGVRVAAGNFAGAGLNITGNDTNFVLEMGANDGHGVLSGCNINHATSYAVHITGQANGFTFDGCHFYYGGIYLKDSEGIVFDGGDIDVLDYYFENSHGTRFVNVKLVDGLSNTIHNDYNSTTSSTSWENCKNLSGHTPGWAGSIIGGYVKATLTGSNQTIADGADAVILFDTVDQQRANHTGFTDESLFDIGTGAAIFRGLGDGHVRVDASLRITIYPGSNPQKLNCQVIDNANARIRFLPLINVDGVGFFQGDFIWRPSAIGQTLRLQVFNATGSSIDIGTGGETRLICEGL